MSEINVGSRVKLKSGGPVMTVANVLESGALFCVWFVGVNSDKVSSASFSPASLEILPDRP